MRRFVAYLSLAIASVATIGATFNAAITQSQTNIEYSDGHAIVFKTSNKDNSEDLEENEAPSKVIAEKMEERLNIYGETRYDVITQGRDMVKVVLSETSSKYRDEIKEYLTFDGSFALGTETDVIAVGDKFMDADKDCYVTFVDHMPTVVIPVNKKSEELKAVIEEAKKIDSEKPEPEADPETGETPAKEPTFVYLAYDYVEGEKMSDLIKTNENTDENVQEKSKIKLQFDINTIWFDSESQDAIKAQVSIVDENNQTSLDIIGQRTHFANYIVNLLNAEELPFEVDFIYEKPVPAYFESLINLGMRETVAWSRTLTATIFAIVILCLLLAVFYRWGAVAVGTLSVASAYIALLFALLFTVEFNTASVIGLCAVALASIASGIIYLTKTKEEAYRGRTLKKANMEGAKRSLLPIVDINVALIIIGACVYWLGGAMMTSFAAIAVFGGIVSLILNTLGLKGMMWLLTNTTKFQGNYSVIGVENSKVPNILNEEVQTYYGPYQDSNPTKNKKVLGIISAVLFAASLVGTVTFGCLDNGVIFNDSGYRQENTYLYVETTNTNSVITREKVDSFFKDVKYVQTKDGTVADGAWEKANELKYAIDSYEHSKVINKETNTVETTQFIVLTLDGSFNEYTVFQAYKDGTGEEKTVVATGSLEDIFNAYNTDGVKPLDGKAKASFKIGTRVNAQQPNYSLIIASVAVGVAFVALYFVLRYGLSRGLVSLIVTTLTGFVTVGIFTLTRASVGLDLFIALPLIMVIALALSIISMNKEKEMIRDDKVKSKDNTIEHREELMIKSSALALGPILVFTAMAVYLMVNFFGFGVAAASNIFMFALVGTLIAAVLVAILYGPTSHFLYKSLRKLNIKKPDIKKPHKKNKKKAVKAKSAEPEEAIFIGIND